MSRGSEGCFRGAGCGTFPRCRRPCGLAAIGCGIGSFRTDSAPARAPFPASGRFVSGMLRLSGGIRNPPRARPPLRAGPGPRRPRCGPVAAAARHVVPAKRSGSQNLSANTRNRVLFATIPSRLNCCSGFLPVHLSRGAHLKAPFCHAARARPAVSEGRDVAQAAARQPPEAGILVFVHQRVPQRTFLRLRQTDLDLGLREVLGRFPQDRAGLHALANRHAGSIAHAARERRRKPQSRPNAGACNAAMPAVKRHQPILSLGKP